MLLAAGQCGNLCKKLIFYLKLRDDAFNFGDKFLLREKEISDVFEDAVFIEPTHINIVKDR